MNAKEIRVVILVSMAVALCWLGAPLWGSAGQASFPLSRAPLLFDADAALATTREFVTRNPRRILGSLEARQATGFLQGSLQKLGYQISFTHFEAMIAGKRQIGRNVLGFKTGALPGILAVIAHYDTARTTVQGAMDDGSGVGVLLQLAQVFAKSPLRHSLLLIVSDGEEWGMLGASDIATHYPDRQRIAAVLSLDWVGIGALAAFKLDTIGQRSGYSPAWLRRIALRAAEEQGLPVVMPAGFQEIVQRAIPLSLTDQGPFANAGIPAINLSSISVQETRVWNEIYHSDNDRMENLNAASIGIYGAAAERLLRSIDELPAIPTAKDDAFRWRNDTFVSAWAMGILQCLTFLPFLVVLGFGWRRGQRAWRLEGALREASIFLTWMLPFALFYSLILFCRLMRLLPRNSYYPGPLHDPMLAQPAWGLLAGIAGAATAVGIGLHFLLQYLMRRNRGSYRESKLILMALLVIVILLAFLYNAYWATVFLALPSLIWSTVGRGRTTRARIAGVLAIPAAGFVFYLVAVNSERSVNVGWDVIWYAVLGLSTGMLQWQGYFLSAAAIVLGLRFLALQSSRTPN